MRPASGARGAASGASAQPSRRVAPPRRVSSFPAASLSTQSGGARTCAVITSPRSMSRRVLSTKTYLLYAIPASSTTRTPQYVFLSRLLSCVKRGAISRCRQRTCAQANSTACHTSTHEHRTQREFSRCVDTEHRITQSHQMVNSCIAPQLTALRTARSVSPPHCTLCQPSTLH